MPFNDEYWMGGTVSGHNPIFGILARNQPMVYSGGAISSFSLNTQGLAQAVRQFSAACQSPFNTVAATAAVPNADADAITEHPLQD